MRIFKKKKEQILERVKIVILSIITVIFLFPLIWALLTSFKLHRDIFVFPPKVIFLPTLKHYETVLYNSPYFLYMTNSIIVSFTSASISVLIGFLAAYSFSRFRIRGANNLLLWVLSLRMVPPLAVSVPFYLMAISAHLYDTRLGLSIFIITFNLPFALWLQLSYLNQLPKDIEEAALVDGCSRLKALFKIVFPLAIPGIISTFIFCLIFSWNEFPISLVLTSQNAKTLPVSMVSWDTQRGLLWGELMSAGIMAIAPVLVFTILIQRYLIRGLTMGAIVE